MKKLYLTMIGLLATSSLPSLVNEINYSEKYNVSNYQKDDIYSKKEKDAYAAFETWNSVGIDFGVQTKKSGTQSKTETKLAQTVSTSTFTQLTTNGLSIIKVNGDFVFGTYTNPESANSLGLVLNQSKSTDDTKFFYYEKTHEAWKGWGHHTSRISLELVVKQTNNNPNDRASITLTSTAYARTAGAVHRCKTKIKIDSVDFYG